MLSTSSRSQGLFHFCVASAALAGFIVAGSAPASGQMTLAPATQHADLQHTSNGQLSITAQGPWSLEQAIARLRREYGWVVDYEESIPTQSNIVTRPDGRVTLRSRALSISSPAPVAGAATDVKTTLQSVVSQLNSADYPEYRVLNTTTTRFDVTPATGSNVALLDTPIVLPSGSRSIAKAIQEILAAVQTKTGYPIVRGGLADFELDRVQVSFNDTSESPARTLLAQALDGAKSERVWILTYDPSAKGFVIGIEPAVRLVKTPSGQSAVTAVMRQPVE